MQNLEYDTNLYCICKAIYRFLVCLQFLVAPGNGIITHCNNNAEAMEQKQKTQQKQQLQNNNNSSSNNNPHLMLLYCMWI